MSFKSPPPKPHLNRTGSVFALPRSFDWGHMHVDTELIVPFGFAHSGDAQPPKVVWNVTRSRPQSEFQVINFFLCREECGEVFGSFGGDKF